MAEATVQQSTMLGEKGSVLAPEWAERLVETTASVSWSSASEEEKGKEGTAAPTVDPAPTATAPKTNTIALKDDEQLVYENGEMKVVKNKQQVKRERPDEGDSKKKKPKPDPVAGGRSNGLAMSREELQSMVAEWNISDTLKQVILVGLQPPRTVVQLPDPD
ncbi:hypothetical protein AGDE_15368 [Angomonas deanei]|nr:hypothetical protein AGDE_15368 [Angomonas deanei]|eukprot:EPY19198.1 hypothetical protein AGDE_15368 [Angomonas deanei]